MTEVTSALVVAMSLFVRAAGLCDVVVLGHRSGDPPSEFGLSLDESLVWIGKVGDAATVPEYDVRGGPPDQLWLWRAPASIDGRDPKPELVVRVHPGELFIVPPVSAEQQRACLGDAALP